METLDFLEVRFIGVFICALLVSMILLSIYLSIYLLSMIISHCQVLAHLKNYEKKLMAVNVKDYPSFDYVAW